MEISRDKVEYVAHLARLNLTEAELDTFVGQLDKIVEYIDQLKQIDVSETAPTEHILPLYNVKRKDTLSGSLSPEDALENAPQRDGASFKLPKVIE